MSGFLSFEKKASQLDALRLDLHYGRRRPTSGRTGMSSRTVANAKADPASRAPLYRKGAPAPEVYRNEPDESLKG